MTRQRRERDNDIFSPDEVGWQNMSGWDSENGTALITGSISFTPEFLELLLEEFDNDNPRVVDKYNDGCIKVQFALREPNGNTDYSGNVYVAKEQQKSRGQRGSRRRRDDDDEDEAPKSNSRGRTRTSARDTGKALSLGGNRKKKPASQSNRTSTQKDTQKTTDSGNGTRQSRNGNGGTSRSEGKASGTNGQNSKQPRSSQTQSEQRRTRPRG